MSAVVIDRGPAPAAAATGEPLIQLEGVGKSFAVQRGSDARMLRAVDGVSLDLRRGEVLAIVGESGSGKTTLGRMMLGLMAPSAGQVAIGGRPPAALGKRALARLVQPIFQDPYSSLNARKTVGDIVGLPLRIHGLGSHAERRKKVAAMIERVGLPTALIHAFPSQLSGGQRQRVAIARALITQPEIVVCDEPTSALDVSVQAQILNLLKDLRDEFDLTYLFISHNLGVVEFLADRIGVMYLGRLVELGAAAEVLARPRHPYTRALLGSVLTPDPALGLPEAPLRGQFPDPLDPPPGCAFHPRCPVAFDRCAEIAPRTLHDAAGLIECHRHDAAVAAPPDAAR
ncbi:MAG TPA: oligopeptide/dipeptide ABC transporter ATP-binding protein [Hyphomicrobiales bacterium]|nr:oligopeptide/dipeptide ABC transporter ATP-binding protein [Hyphomicrobiales bacterium]